MARQSLFAYRVQLPDGSEVIRQGGADRPPTMSDLADLAANQGERFLGPVAMTPAGPPPAPAATAVPQPGPPPTPPPAAAAAPPAAPASGLGAEVRATVIPERTFLSEVPQIIGGIGGGLAPVGPFRPLTAGAGSALMETGVLGAEQLMGWPPAEPGGPVKRVGRAFTRGAAGEGITRAGIAGYRALTRGARPVMEAAEALKPVLTREVPKDLVFGPRGLAGPQIAVDALVKDPAALAKMGTELTPEMQQTVLTRWWQTNAEGGPKQVIKAWDALGTVEGAQQALAGAYHGPLTAMVDTLRGVGKLPQTYSELLRAGPLATAALMTGHPYVAGATGLVSSVVPREAPRLFLHPGPAAVLTELPQMARQAAPVVRFGLRTAAQLGTGELERQPGGAFGWQVPEAAP